MIYKTPSLSWKQKKKKWCGMLETVKTDSFWKDRKRVTAESKADQSSGRSYKELGCDWILQQDMPLNPHVATPVLRAKPCGLEKLREDLKRRVHKREDVEPRWILRDVPLSEIMSLNHHRLTIASLMALEGCKLTQGEKEEGVAKHTCTSTVHITSLQQEKTWKLVISEPLELAFRWLPTTC